MGLIKEIVLLPLAPVRFTVWAADKVAAEADRQRFSSPAAVQQLDALERSDLDEEKTRELQGQVIEEQLSRAEPTPDQEEGADRG